MEQQKTEKTWLQEEAENLKTTAFNEERLPALKFQENKITEITIDFSSPFEKWTDTENNTVKKIIPVTTKEGKFVWWLNVKNPIYGILIQKGSQGQSTFKILQTGNRENTKYTLVE